jgi:hypothetical protein
MSTASLVLSWGRYGLTPAILSIKSKSTKSTSLEGAIELDSKTVPIPLCQHILSRIGEGRKPDLRANLSPLGDEDDLDCIICRGKGSNENYLIHTCVCDKGVMHPGCLAQVISRPKDEATNMDQGESGREAHTLVLSVTTSINFRKQEQICGCQ